jgi:outer membrane protein assembly factor BamB
MCWRRVRGFSNFLFPDATQETSRMETPRMPIFLLALLTVLVQATPAAPAGQDPASAYPEAAVSVLSHHRAIAQQWYRLLASSQPAPAPMAVRLIVPRCYGNTSLALEFLQGSGLTREARVWETSGRNAPRVADCSKLAATGAAESGSVDGEFSVFLPDDVSGTTNRMRVEVKASIAGGKVQGTFTASVMGATVKGALSGTALAASAAADAVPVRGLLELDFKGRRASEIYAIAAGIEQDAALLYRQIRALVAARGDRRRFEETFVTNAIPIPVRKPFDDKVAQASKTPATRSEVLKPVVRKEKELNFDLDAIGDAGLEGETTAPKIKPPAPKTDDPAHVAARLPTMLAMVANTAWMKSAVAAHVAADGADPVVQRGMTFDDPLFGPWYGNGSLASWTGSVNRLPADAGSPGVQDWPFVHAWQSLGPFAFAELGWDPIRLPEAMPVADTEFMGKVGPSRWKPAYVTAAGCVILTDLDSYQAAADEEDDQPSGTPGKAARRPNRNVYYAATTIESDKDIEILFAAGCTGYLTIWHDEVLAARGPAVEDPGWIPTETMAFRLRLHKGANRLLVRCESAAYGLFNHGRAGTASYMWMRVCTSGAPGDPKQSRAWMDEAAKRKRDLPNVPQNVRLYRGDQSGHYADANPVTAWDIDRGINVLWSTDLQRWSKAAPTVSGDRVFVCAEPHVLICLDTATGKILWQRTANVLELIDRAKFQESENLYKAYLDGKEAVRPRLMEMGRDHAARLKTLMEGGKTPPRAHAELCGMEGDAERLYNAFEGHLAANAGVKKFVWDGGYHGPWWVGLTFGTPVTDGKRVFVKFHTGVTAAYDFDGNRLWMVRTPFETLGTSACLSPALADDKLIVPFAVTEQAQGCLLLLKALDAASGRELWTAKADSRSQTSSPVVMRLTDGKNDMTVVVTDAGTVARTDDGKVLIGGIRGGCSQAPPTPVGDVLYRIELSLGGAVRLIMLDRDHVGANWLWHQSLYNALYAGVAYHDGFVFGITHGGAQCIAGRGIALIDERTGLQIERPFNQPAQTKDKGIYLCPRGGFVPPTSSPRALYIGMRGRWNPGSEDWIPYSYVSVLQPGGLGRFIAHNKVVGPLTPPLTLAGDKAFLRSDAGLTCLGYTGDEGKAYEAEVNAATILEDVPDSPPSDAEGAALWKRGIETARPFLDRAIALKPESPAATRAKALLAKIGGR